MSKVVSKYYDSQAINEWERLERPYRRLEFVSTIRLIKKYFPQAGHICDVGSGPGRYSIELLKRGYRVTMFDISEASLQLAKAKLKELGLEAERIICGDARDMSQLSDSEFDGVLLMGPMYHVIQKADRLHILKEVRRILRDSGVAIIACLNAWGIIRAGITEFPRSYEDIEYLRSLLDEKIYEGPQGGFTECYFTTPPAAIAEIKSAGLELISYAGCEGFASGTKRIMEELFSQEPTVYWNLVRVVAENCEAAQFRDTTEHLHLVVRKQTMQVSHV